MPQIEELRNRNAAITLEITRLQNAGKGGSAEVSALIDELEQNAAELGNAERLDALGRPIRKTRDELSNSWSTTGVSAAGATTSTISFKSGTFRDESEFYLAVARAGIHNLADPRLISNASGDLVREAAGADGGFALPVDKRSLQALLVPPEAICGKTDILLTPSNAVTLPVDEDPVWSTTMGAADVDEGAALTETKPSLKTLTLTLAKKGVLVRVTGEMLEDGTNIGPYVLTKTGQKLSWKLDAICFAAFQASGAKKTIAKTGGAAAGSAPDLANVQAMWTSMLVQQRETAIWIANPKLETTLQNFVVGTGSGTSPVYIPAGGISGASFSTLYGRPIIFSELSPAVGAEGDLMLVDPKSFFCVLKSGGPRTDVSIHAEFAKDIVAYRSYVRAVCASKFSALITRGDGTTVGNVVTVAVRA